MADHMQAEMAEALRLTRAGRLAEATALIQRTLRYGPNPAMPMAAPTAADSPPLVPLPVALEAVPDPLRPAARDHGPVAADRIPSQPAGRHVHSRPAGRHVHSRPAAGDVPAAPVLPGAFVDGTYSNAAGTRAYRLYIPGRPIGTALPLVVMLHGCTQSAEDFAAGTRMNEWAEREAFLVAYPEQATTANGSRCWNWFQVADQERDAGEPSLIAGITQQIMGAYPVDAGRVYVAGLSAGGAMAAVMAATYPDLYAAVGVHSGLAYGAAHDVPSAFAAMSGTPEPARPLDRVVPLIVFHGDRDARVAAANADHLLAQWLRAADAAAPGNGRPIREPTLERRTVPGGHTYTRLIHRDAAGTPIAEKWTIHHAGHAWSGGSSAGSHTDPRGPDASAAMVRFFHEHGRDR